MDERINTRWPTLAAVAMLILAIPEDWWPYSYYQILRLVVTAVAAYLSYLHQEEGHGSWPTILVLTAFLYNPFVPVELEKHIWVQINAFTAALLTLGHLNLTDRKPVILSFYLALISIILLGIAFIASEEAVPGYPYYDSVNLLGLIATTTLLTCIIVCLTLGFTALVKSPSETPEEKN